MKILIIHASAGAGHAKAAEAIHNRIKSTSSHEAVLVDVLDITSSFYKKVYRGIYIGMVTHVPWMWGFFFWFLDIPWLLWLFRFGRRINNAIALNNLRKYLIKEDFDCIVSTHFDPNEVAGYLKRTDQIRAKLICCVTDFDVHSIWLSKGVEHYCVASEFTRQKIVSMGVSADQVTVSGIPTDEKFSQQRDKGQLRQQIGIAPDKFTVLIATGSFGFGPIEEILKKLEGCQSIIVCGHNKTLFSSLSAQDIPDAKVFAFVNNMDELMASADVMITKPGGLSISEALVSNLGLIFFSSIPGQETNNIKVLKQHGIGISDCSIEEMAAKVKEYATNPESYGSVREKTKELARPNAAEKIAQIAQS